MLTTLAVANYRSINQLIVPLARLNLITGPNGSGKSNLYRALRLLAETAQGGVVNALAREGGLESTFWAGPEVVSRRMKSGEVAIEGGPRNKVKRLRMGFAADDFSYAIALGVSPPELSAFTLDPQIKHESIWVGPSYRPASELVERNGPMIRARTERSWQVLAQHTPMFDSLFDQVGSLQASPEVLRLRESIRGWRFYDHFRTDPDAPVRQPQLGTRTPVLHHDGRDLAAALQTILEMGDPQALHSAISDAFPGARLEINALPGGRFAVEFYQEGLLRPLSAAELSDGTLRYLLLVAALLTPRPPTLMVLNEPETSLHPDLLPALARLIIRTSLHSQVWVVSHARRLIAALQQDPECNCIVLEKNLGQTEVVGQRMLDQPAWHWAD
ncbi:MULTISPECIES: AAA family ATPase [unclassified Pseudomonas]|uniref:AAA family ATPase n=1 Tax=unclassified Pseudomonas TaxID=196821 RepID=UPI001297D6DB|nr:MULTISPECIES: AAA family ATPase [unclassified Pseudomonas]MQT41925.1 AAA family ATPase [Pseudomonas sp. FSL R10-0765]MQT52600.1 AAA family ATPase [Pseudomonas sp. FSL R10-2398]MQT99004.1 AAA family ATPase [Pseudomonas sp. FSL R10-2245]MQU13263.1 AAA family ATPase [Pseudomonas sp. FSL R10-2189]MQU38431.1 AAA family ATPase [Pseudomonas sp. FSL R10-2172]